MLRDVPVVKDLIKRCLRCGLCREVCPVFNETKREDDSPRGKIFYVELMRNGELDTNRAVDAKLFNCLLCESCRNICPSSIPVDEIITAARAESAKVNSHPFKRWVYNKLWTSPVKLRLFVRALGLGQRLGLIGLGRAAGFTHILPGDMPRAERIMGRIPKKSAREILPAVSPAIGLRKYRLVYFLGCGTDLLYPEIAVAAVKVLTNLGCEVDIVPDLKCCGLPQLGNGEENSARELAAFNTKLINLRDADAIISDCASCSSTLKSHLYRGLFKEGFDDKIMDVQVFIAKIAGTFKPDKAIAPITVTYHDSCHLSKALKITKEPRELLKRIPGVTFVEMDDADKCCGGSGTFPMSHYDLSMKILDRKVTSIAKSGAGIVAAACPGCITQIGFGVKEKKMDVRVMHPLEIMAEMF